MKVSAVGCFLPTLLLFSIFVLTNPTKEMSSMKYALTLPDSQIWVAHTDWLGNPAAEFGVSQREGGLDFSVPEPGCGMKWSRHFDAPIDTEKMPHLMVRYRAEGISAFGDYFLYLNGRVGDLQKEFYVIMPGDLADDGRWRTICANVPPAQMDWLAMQVQAKSPKAHIQVESIIFTSEKPEFSLVDVLEYKVSDLEDGLADGLNPGDMMFVDLASYCNGDSNEKLPLMGLTPQWFQHERISADGIPFQVVLKPPNLLSTTLNAVGQFTVPINSRASEIYLLLGAHYEGEEEPSIGSGKLTQVRHVERFVVEIKYIDGVKDFIFPARIGSQRHIIEATMGVYSVMPTRQAEVEEISIHDDMRQGEFYLAGLTLNTREGENLIFATRKTTEVALGPQRESQPTVAPDMPITIAGNVIKLDNGCLRSVMNIENGLAMTSLENRYTGAECLSSPTPLFAVKYDDRWIDSSEFQVTDIATEKDGKATILSMEYDAIGGRLTLSFNDANQLAFDLQLTNLSPVEIKLTPAFLTLENLFIIDVAQDSKLEACSTDQQWYCFPRRGTVINNIPISLNAPYSGSFPMQFIDVYHPSLGGVYVMKHDLTAEYKWFRLKKDAAISLQIDYLEKSLKPQESIVLPEAVIGVHAGDWHEALRAYREWVQSWYQPAAPRKPWFREIFNFRQQFMHFALPRKSGMFDDDTKEYHFRAVIDKDIDDFGGVDYWHIFDWAWSKEYGRCGDYNHWDQIGGAPAFRKAISEIQEMGIPVGLYIEGYLVDPQSNIGKTHGEEWQLLDQDGKPYSYFAPSYNICSAVPEWQEYLAATYARIQRETNANGFYVDEMGFADPGHFCYSPHHGHPTPEPPLRGQRDLLRRIRASLPPDVAVYTEECPTDVNSQYQDGAFTYAISSVSDDWSPTHLNLYRFAFPAFKTIEIITCDRPLGSDYQSVKRIFFNGEGIWIEGIAEDWFTPETRAFIAKMHQVFRAHLKAFTTLNPMPLVPTRVGDIYANEFPATHETVWTLYNARYSTVRGELFAVKHQEGAKYVDVWNEQSLNPRIFDGYAYLSLELGPKDVGCVAQLRAPFAQKNEAKPF